MKTNYRPHNGLDEMIRRNENRRDSSRITPKINYPLVFPGKFSITTTKHDGRIITIAHEMKTNYRPHNGLLEMLGINKQTEYPKSTLPIRDIDESRYLWEEDGMTVVVRDKTIECGGNFMRFATIDLFDLRKLRMVFAGEEWKKIESKSDGVRMVRERIRSDPDLAVKWKLIRESNT